MITTVDSNVLIDILNESERWTPDAVAALRSARSRGVTVICDIVYAEVCAAFDRRDRCDQFLESFLIKVEALHPDASFAASRAWISYRKNEGNRVRILPDFLVAAHASHHADRLLTRDRGFVKTYLPNLEVIDPSVSGK
jgi:predicted nucleic acid-binding protein